jgi:hypothetical protein
MWGVAALLALGGGIWWLSNRRTAPVPSRAPSPTPARYTGPQLNLYGTVGTQNVEVSRHGDGWAWYASNGSGAEVTRGEAFEVVFGYTLPNAPQDASTQLTFGNSTEDERIGLDVIPSEGGFAWTTQALRAGEAFKGASGWAQKRGVALREAYDSVEKEGY